MSHRIEKAVPVEPMKVMVVFQNGVEKLYDIQQLCSVFPQFMVLKSDKELYKQVKTDVGGAGISWNDELDLDAEELWEHGICTGKQYALEPLQELAVKLTEARESRKMTQKVLAECTGITQGDISKIENGRANPSVQTLQRLAEGLQMTLQIDFRENDY